MKYRTAQWGKQSPGARVLGMILSKFNVYKEGSGPSAGYYTRKSCLRVTAAEETTSRWSSIAAWAWMKLERTSRSLTSIRRFAAVSASYAPSQRWCQSSPRKLRSHAPQRQNHCQAFCTMLACLEMSSTCLTTRVDCIGGRRIERLSRGWFMFSRSLA